MEGVVVVDSDDDDRGRRDDRFGKVIRGGLGGSNML